MYTIIPSTDFMIVNCAEKDRLYLNTIILNLQVIIFTKHNEFTLLPVHVYHYNYLDKLYFIQLKTNNLANVFKFII